MSAITKFKFVSPGIFVNEIDNSQVPAQPEALGPVIIGRTERGPALIPTKVSSFEEFVNVFGAPIATEPAADVWRNGNRQGPTYASYAAQAWLAAGQAPVTVVRLLGAQDPDATTADGAKAGWITSKKTFSTTIASNGGAYGLFICDSSSCNPTSSAGSSVSGTFAVAVTGALAAVWYIDNGHMALTGTTRFDGTQTASVGEMIKNIGADHEFKAIVYKADGTTAVQTAFNFNRDSEKYIRKVFNTNPQLVNTTVTATANRKNYFLGQSYTRFLADTTTSGSAAGDSFAIMLPMASGTVVYGSDFRGGYMLGKSGWVISQDLATNVAAFKVENMQKLFRFVALDAGEEACRKFKVSIANIRPSQVSDDVNPFGTFDVLIRAANDRDNAIKIVERFTSCDLNPNSLNYIARKIGDKYSEWDDTATRFRYYGNFDNVSKHFRVEVNTAVNEGKTDAKYLPFGFLGPTRFTGFDLYSGSSGYQQFGGELVHGKAGNESSTITPSMVTTVINKVPKPSWSQLNANGAFINFGTAVAFSGSFKFPSIALRISASDGAMSNPKNAYFGIRPTRIAASTVHDEDYSDYVFPLAGSPAGYVDNFTPTSYLGSTTQEYSILFSLDDIRVTGSSTNPVGQAYWESGSRAGGNSYTADNSASALLETAEYDKFTFPIFGGFDALEITEVEPFRNSRLDDSSVPNANYTFYTIKRAIDSVSDPEEFECNLMVMPNVQNETLTTHLIQTCEDRGDALAVIDLNGDYQLTSENTNAQSTRRPDLDNTIQNLRLRGLNSSYGCAFYPYVQIRDNINGAVLDCPPSVVALGTFASSQAASELWFAPAGFNRGGLSQGAAGIPVTGVKQRLNSKDRDKLYAANVNPIATFPSEGIVVFGQKTLQVTPSALDRINVRRLLIYLKKEISRIAATILFDPNVEVTWARFRNAAETFLASVKAGLGLSEYKIVLDSTTTTPDLIDRNAIYAKIFLKPARAIEFIAIDFVITRTGAAFED